MFRREKFSGISAPEGPAVAALPRNGFYDYKQYKKICGSGGSGKFKWDPVPGFTADNPPASGRQYRRPVSLIKDVPCKSVFSPKNSQSIWMRCDSDYDVWFNDIVPKSATAPETGGVFHSNG